MASGAVAQELGMGVLQDGDVSLSVVWEVKDAGVLGRYTLHNSGRARLFVFDRLYQTSVTGARQVSPDIGWRWLEPAGMYRVAKYVPDLPRGQRVESPDLPYARIVEPGAALAGQVALPGKLDQWLPYDQTPTLAAVPKVAGLVLTLGYAEMDDAAAPNTIGKDEALVYSLPFDWAITRQRLVSSEPFKVGLPMMPTP